MSGTSPWAWISAQHQSRLDDMPMWRVQSTWAEAWAERSLEFIQRALRIEKECESVTREELPNSPLTHRSMHQIAHQLSHCVSSMVDPHSTIASSILSDPLCYVLPHGPESSPGADMVWPYFEQCSVLYSNFIPFSSSLNQCRVPVKWPQG